MENEKTNSKNIGQIISIIIIIVILVIGGLYIWGGKMIKTEKTTPVTQETAEQVIDETSQDLSNIDLSNLDLDIEE